MNSSFGARLRACWMLVAALAAVGCESARAQEQSGSVAEEALAVQGRARKAPRVPVGLNLGELAYYAPANPFVDLMKTSDSFETTPVSGAVWNSEHHNEIPVDDRGYPLEVPFQPAGSDEPQLVRYSVASLLYPGRYTLRYEGQGELQFPASPVQIVASGPGRVELEVPEPLEPGTFLFVVIARSQRGDHVRNLRILSPGAGRFDVIHPAYFRVVRGASVLRFMDWQRTNGSEASSWEERALPQDDQAGASGASLEIMLGLANRAGADPWLCVPHAADDAYVEQMAKLVHQRLAAHQAVYLELSNELWNPGFAQWQYSVEQGCLAGYEALEPNPGSCDEDDGRFWAGLKWQAARSARIFEIFQRSFRGHRRLVRVLAGQAAWTDRNRWLLEAFTNPALNPRGVGADALAIAPYFGEGVADDIRAEAGGGSAEDILEAAAASIELQVTQATRDNKLVADSFGLRLVAYEGGQHLVATGPGGDDEALTAALMEANRSPQMQALYERMFETWYAESGRELIVLYNDIGAPNRWGSWGLLESQVQPALQAPKYLAYLKTLARLWYGGYD